MSQARNLVAVTAVIASLIAAGCSDSVSAPQQNTQQSATPQQPLPLRALPDFTPLVQQYGPTVVNISTTQALRRGGQQMPEIPGLSEDDPFFEFFRRFIPKPESGPRGPRAFPAQSLGSGFIVSDDGYILTSAHVISNAEEITVRLTDRREFKAKVVGVDKRTDVAVLKIDATGLPTAPLGTSEEVKVGEWVVAIGSPFGFENSVTAGIVSAKGRSLPDETYVPFLQTDVAVNPGNSGGPLFNLKGEVVGINSQIFSRTGGYMGLSFAIPIELAMDVSKQLRTTGKVSRGRLGVVIQSLTPELARSFGKDNARGALVSSVEKGSPAEKAGIQPGDVILKYDGKTVETSAELPPLVATTRPGSKAELQIWRKGSTKELQVTVAELPGEKVAAGGDSRPGAKEEVNKLGLALSELSAEQKKELKTDHGIMVSDAQGVAARAGIRAGDVILAVKGNEVKSVEEFNNLVKQAPADQPLALLIQRGESTLYVAVKPETDKG
jgi:serine protease Do